MARLSGKVAIVTGAGIGQGKATALRLAREGAAVVAADVSGAEKDTAAEMPEMIAAVTADVTRSADVAALVAEAMGRHGRLDILCNADPGVDRHLVRRRRRYPPRHARTVRAAGRAAPAPFPC